MTLFAADVTGEKPPFRSEGMILSVLSTGGHQCSPYVVSPPSDRGTAGLVQGCLGHLRCGVLDVRGGQDGRTSDT